MVLDKRLHTDARTCRRQIIHQENAMRIARFFSDLRFIGESEKAGYSADEINILRALSFGRPKRRRADCLEPRLGVVTTWIVHEHAAAPSRRGRSIDDHSIGCFAFNNPKGQPESDAGLLKSIDGEPANTRIVDGHADYEMKSIALDDHGHVKACPNQCAIRKSTACPKSSW